MGQLFHFSDDPTIEVFEPRPRDHPARRHGSLAWLNGPLVWAIHPDQAAHYLFPRDCPRIVVSPTPATRQTDKEAILGPHPRIAYIETRWLDALKTTTLYRYTLPDQGFVSLNDAGMYVSPAPVTPIKMDAQTNLPECLQHEDVVLIPRDRLTDLLPLWDSTLAVSGMRLRNAQDWPAKR